MKLNMKQKMLLAAGLLTTSAVSLADITLATGAIGSIGTDAASLMAAAWPVLTAVTVGFVLMKLFKKASSKAT
jgi:hypothetical protein